ncbi:hypothetical protein B0H13DRAFT_1853528 [Mycena leptocephala]|nr:hypothetical protein B0H13DRAFT_1853528 [Mycena leptocephala]
MCLWSATVRVPRPIGFVADMGSSLSARVAVDECAPRDYYWAHEHYQWPKQKWVNVAPCTPLNAIVSGPVAGGPFEADDPAPRTVSEAWFDVVCPRRERRYINTHDVRPAVNQAPGIEVLNQCRLGIM